MEENNNQDQETRSTNIESREPEPEKKAGVFTLIIGIILIVRGYMRYNEQGGMEVFGIIMLVVGLISIGLFFRNRS